MQPYLRLAWLLVSTFAFAACGSGGGPADGSADAPDARADCGAIIFVPPIVTVVDAMTGRAICDPTFAVVGGPDAGAAGGPATACSALVFGCPVGSTDAGNDLCEFAFAGPASPIGTYQVQVSRAGFEPATISVTSGVAGCATPTAASYTTVELRPVTQDASTDGG